MQVDAVMLVNVPRVRGMDWELADERAVGGRKRVEEVSEAREM